VSRTLTDADYDRLRVLARSAFEDGANAEVDPDTLLALATDAPMLRAQLRRLTERWRRHGDEYASERYADDLPPDRYAQGLALCADELDHIIAGDTSVLSRPPPPPPDQVDYEDDDA
jgi:hypothetical protein